MNVMILNDDNGGGAAAVDGVGDNGCQESC